MTPITPITISEEAREVVLKLHVESQNQDDLRRAHWHEDYLWHKGVNLAICAKEIQLAINSATEKLTAENERLREAIWELQNGKYSAKFYAMRVLELEQQLSAAVGEREKMREELREVHKNAVLGERYFSAKELSDLSTQNQQLRNEIARLNGQTNFACECGGTKIEVQQLQATILSLRSVLENYNNSENWLRSKAKALSQHSAQEFEKEWVKRSVLDVVVKTIESIEQTQEYCLHPLDDEKLQAALMVARAELDKEKK